MATILKWFMKAFVAACVFIGGMGSAVAQNPAPQALMPQHTFAPMLRRLLPSVVGVFVVGREPIEQDNAFYHHPVAGVSEAERSRPPKTSPFSASGSGVIIATTGDAGVILTNYHVIANADRIGVKLYDGRSFEAQLIGQDAASATAVLKVDASKLSRAHFGRISEVEIGDRVFAIGNPLGLSSTVTSGIVSSLFRSTVGYRDYEGFIQHDASVNPGNSGGALVNMKGEVIGINTAIKSPIGGSIGLSFAQPIGLMLKMAGQLIRYGRVHRGEIGIKTADLKPGIAAKRHLAVSEGAIIERVRPNSSAEKSGLKVGDVIVAMQMPLDVPFMENRGTLFEVPIRSHRSVETIIGIHAVGEKLMIEFYRGKERKSVTVELSELSGAMERRPMPKEIIRLAGLVVSSLGPTNPKFGEVHGVVVAEVKSGTIAQFSGFLPRDIITHLNGHRVNGPDDLFDFAEHESKKKIELKVLRDGAPILVRIPLF